MTRWLGSWRELPLARRFGLAGGAVMLVAMLLVGFWITERIQRAVIDNTAAASALYMESFISPLSQELARQDALSEPAVLALQEMMSGTPLGARVVSLKIWKPGGYVVYASDPAIVGKHLPPTAAQKTAWGARSRRISTGSTPTRIGTRRRLVCRFSRSTARSGRSGRAR